MRKCPNCRKPIPVGARRCVHCRTLVSEFSGSDPSSTRMGLGSRRGEAPDFDVNNTTSFGRPGSEETINRVGDLNARLPESRAFGASPNQTMIGLGPISGPRRRQEPMPDRNFAQTTIAGMPGINFDRNKPEFLGQPQTTETPKPREEQARPVIVDKVSEPFEATKVEGANEPFKLDLFESRPDSSEDALFALPGVAPAPSSLVDEEFVDLTAQLFGADFAMDTETSDEEDGWDFDFFTPNVSDAAGDKIIQSIDGHFKSDSDAPAIPTPSQEKWVKTAIDSSSSQAKTSNSREAVEEKTSNTNALPNSESLEAMLVSRNAALPLAPVAATDALQKRTGRSDSFVTSMALLSGVLSIAWIFIPSWESQTVFSSFVNGPLNLLLVLVASMVAIVDFSSVRFAKKQHNMTMSLVFMAMFILLCAMVIVAPVGAWLPQRYILVAAGIGNFICAIYYFLKQA